MATASNLKQNVKHVSENVAAGIEKLSERVGLTSQHEGEFTKRIEEQTSKIPSITFLNLAVGSMALSAGLAGFSNRSRPFASFVGLWAPTFLLFGIYNKLVKLEGSDRYSK